MSDAPKYGMSAHLLDLLTERDAEISLTISWKYPKPAPQIIYALQEASLRDEPLSLHVGADSSLRLLVLEASQQIGSATQVLTVRLREVIDPS